MIPIVVGDEKLPLVQAIAGGLGAEILVLETGKFADTEWYVQFYEVSKVKEALVILVGQFEHTSKSSISDQLMQIFFLAHQAKLHGAGRIVAVLPYLPYARQCKDVKGEHKGLFEAVGTLGAAVGIDCIVTCEVHEEMCIDVSPMPLHTIGCESLWCEVLKRVLARDDNDICFVSPDEGGIGRVTRVARLWGAAWAFVKKRRVGHDKSVALELQGADLQGKTVVLIDDIIDTGITIVQACEKVLEHGAKRVLGCFVHPVFSPGAVACLEQSALERAWVCDTILLDGVALGKKITVVSVNDLVVDYVKTVI